MRLVHSDGSECVDGCDAAPLPSAKHTPGPWGTHFSAGIYYIHHANNPHCPVGRCYGGPNHDGNISKDQAADNARLIAAAPDLLEALKLLADCPDPRHCAFRDIMKTVNAAVAKAEGKP